LAAVTHAPHPGDQATVVLFVVGGITWAEIGQLQQLLADSAVAVRVIVGSTAVIAPEDSLLRIVS